MERLSGTADLVPKPTGPLPMLVTGFSRQSLEWIAAHSDGWITYPRSLEQQAELAARWRAAVSAAAPGAFKPFAQSLYVDLTDDPDGSPEPIHLGFPPAGTFSSATSTASERQGYTTSGSTSSTASGRGRESRGDRPGDPAPHRSHPTDRRGRDARTVEEPGEPADAE